MAQLHLYLPDETAELLRERAQREGLSVSAWLAALAKKELTPSWPPGYFEDVIGAWQGELERPGQLEAEQRDSW